MPVSEMIVICCGPPGVSTLTDPLSACLCFRKDSISEGVKRMSFDVIDPAVITAINNGEVRQENFIIASTGCNLKAPARKRPIAAVERRMNQDVTHPIFNYRLSYRRLFRCRPGC